MHLGVDVIRIISSFCLILLLSACSAGVLGRVGDGRDIYRGTATPGLMNAGTITMSNSSGKVCTGTYHYANKDLGVYNRKIEVISSGGMAAIRCNDGTTASMSFHSLSRTSGWGVGKTSNGQKVAFTYGLSEDEASMYLNISDADLQKEAAGQSGEQSAEPTEEATPDRTKPLSVISMGSGFWVSAAGHAVTNNHVVNTCEYMKLQLPDGSVQKADILFTDPTNDLAVIRAAGPVPAIATFPVSPTYRVGDDVVTFGFPLGGGLGMLSSSGVLTTGTISALSGLEDDSRFFQINAAIQHGNRGGPLSDRFGNMIGVNSKGLNAAYFLKQDGSVPQNVNFAIKELVVKTFLKAHSIPFTEVQRTQPLSNADVGDLMRQYTVFAMCVGHPPKKANK